MSRGAFREDLFYRLAVFEIRIPPLRERRDDVLPLAGTFLEEIGAELGRPAAGISRDAKEALLRYGWPGNVRELRNVLERASILSDGGLITHEHLAVAAPSRPSGGPPAVAPASSHSAFPGGNRAAGDPDPNAAFGPPLAQLERSAIERALVEARFNKSRAARALGLTRGQLYGKLRRLGLGSSV
jgi:DNA-binding NtrC family response regulator